MAELSTAHLSPETLSMIEDGEIMEVSIYKKKPFREKGWWDISSLSSKQLLTILGSRVR